MLVVLVHGEHQDGDAGEVGQELPGHCNAVEARHREVGDDDVGVVLADRPQQLVAVTDGLEHSDLVRLGEHRAQSVAVHRVVVGDNDADVHRDPRRRTAVTAVP